MLRLGRTVTGLGFAALITVLALEAALQFAFLHLPSVLIEQMPQYLERSGFRLETKHGAREYPAQQIVDYEITQTSGDLYRLTCLSPDDAPPFDTYHVRFTRDSHGFRNEEPWPDLTDLVIIGDSYVAAEAIGLPFWHGISESLLVLGLPGSGTLEQQRLYEAFAAPRKPKTVVLSYFSGNDLADNLDFAEMLTKGESFAVRAHQGKYSLDYSVVFNLMLYLANSISLGEVLPCHYPQPAATEPRTPVAFYDEFLPVLALDEKSLRDSETFRLTSVSIAEMATAQYARGDRFILMYIPQKVELYWKLLSAQSKESIVSQLDEEYEIAEYKIIDENILAQRNLIAELADELGIEFLDLTASLAAAITDGQQPYFFADTHWNQTGHNIARIALLNQLNQSNLDK